MQTDARLVKDVQNARERCAYLSCKAYSLTLAARESRCAARKAQVLQSDVFEKAETGFYLFNYPVGNDMLFFAELQSVDKVYRFGNGHVSHAGDVYAADRYGERFLSQTLSAAFGACDLGHALFDLGAHGRALSLKIPTLEVFAYTLEWAREFTRKGAVFPLALVAQVELFACRKAGYPYLRRAARLSAYRA